MRDYQQNHHCGQCGKNIPPGTLCISDRVQRRVEYFCSEEHRQKFIVTAQRARQERGY
jgi:ribosomal protein L24E